MAIALTDYSAQITVSYEDGNDKVYKENIGYWKFSSSDTTESVGRTWDSIGRAIANLSTNTYNDTIGKIEFSANEMLE